ncbi:MAG TPA: transposase [Anaerolineales bacterium]|nr:transposase [Anaerolineales bacterium]
MPQRRKFLAEFNARLVLEIINDHKSTVQSCREYGIRDFVLSRWKY